VIDFEVPQELAERAAVIRSFVVENAVPFDTDSRFTGHEPNDALRAELVARAGHQGSAFAMTEPEGVLRDAR